MGSDLVGGIVRQRGLARDRCRFIMTTEERSNQSLKRMRKAKSTLSRCRIKWSENSGL